MTKHTFELAASGRSKCRGCGQSITKDSLRFGERVPNAFGDEDATHWLHPACAAHRRPDSLAEAMAELDYSDDDKPALLATTAITKTSVVKAIALLCFARERTVLLILPGFCCWLK